MNNQTLRALVVEDNPINREVSVGLLSALGYVSECASDGKEALEMLCTEGPYQFILMDLQMPVMNGLEATEKIREYEQANSLSEIPIIAVTANALAETRKACEDVGMNGFVTKPVYIEKLQDAIVAALNV